MKLELVAATPRIEAMIATSMLTTTSGAQPGTLYERLSQRPEKVDEVVGRVELQHGNILEHNRLIWVLEASRDEALEVMLRSRFITFTELEADRWLVSCNLRTLAEYCESHRGEFSGLMLESIKETAPHIHSYIGRRRS